MIKAFELGFKKTIIPVLTLPHISQAILEKVKECKKFKDYTSKFESLEEGVIVSRIQILGVEMFGDRVGFINLRAVTSKDGFKLPQYVFVRGPSVAILVLVNDRILLVQQYRVPVQQTLLEAPAGMLDESGDFVGIAALEIEQQTSIKLKKDQLHSLGSYYPSPGGSDQQIHLFYCQINLTPEQIVVIEQKIHGKAESEHEKIRVKLVTYDPSFVLKTKDSKLISLVYAYEQKVKALKSNL